MFHFKTKTLNLASDQKKTEKFELKNFSRKVEKTY